MAHQLEVTKATPADLAADMEYHRQTYGRFFNLLKWVIVGCVIVLTVLFFMR